MTDNGPAGVTGAREGDKQSTSFANPGREVAHEHFDEGVRCEGADITIKEEADVYAEDGPSECLQVVVNGGLELGAWGQMRTNRDPVRLLQ